MFDQVVAGVEVRRASPVRDVLVNVASGVWTGTLHYWLRIDGRWYAYVVWMEPRPKGEPDEACFDVLPVQAVRPMTPTPCHVRMYLGWSRGEVIGWRLPRGRRWEARVTLYTGRRDKTAGTHWYPVNDVRLGELPAGATLWEPDWR